MLGTVEPLPGARVGEPEVRAAVDDDDIRAELFGQGGRMPVRQTEEHHVMAGQRVQFGRLQDAVGQRQQMRMVFGQRGPGAGRSGECPDGQPAVREGGVPEKQTKHLPSGITAGPGHCDGCHTGDDAWLCTRMQINFNRPGPVAVACCAQRRCTAPTRSAAARTAASRAALASSSVNVRSAARNRSASASDLRPSPIWGPV